MDISSLGGPASTTTPQAAANKAVGKDEFLRLLVTQLRAQNPLNPMNSTEFTSQLAQFSSLEQLAGINSGVKDLALLQGSLQNALTAGLIGKKVRALDGDFSAVQGVAFESGSTSLILENGKNMQLGQVDEITGGN